jgi:hypothetical protein
MFGGSTAVFVLIALVLLIGVLLWVIPKIIVKRLTRLAQTGSQEAVRKLVGILITSNNKNQRRMAFNGLCQLTKQNCIDEVCQVWAEQREPILADLLKQNGYVARTLIKARVLSALKVNHQQAVINGGVEIVEPLLEAFNDSDSEIASRAKQWAKALTNPKAIDLICQTWAQKRSPLFEELIIQGGYVAQTPISVKLLSALKVNHQQAVINGGVEIVEPLLEAFNDSDSEIASRAKQWAKALTNPEAIDLIFQKWTQNRDTQIEELILYFDQSGILRQPYQRALLYFLTQQWDKYETLDFDYQLLKAAYELADESLRQQIGETARKAGRVELVQVLTGGRKGKRLSSMSEADWNTTLTILSGRQEWEQIWLLAQKAPAIFSRRFLQQLKQVNWQPKEEAEFRQLVQLSGQCREEGLYQEALDILTRATYSVECLAKVQDGTLLASGNNDNTVRLFSLTYLPIDAINLKQIDWLQSPLTAGLSRTYGDK